MFDPACYDCAQQFLPSLATERLRTELAQAIQDAVEDWIKTERARIVAALPPGTVL